MRPQFAGTSRHFAGEPVVLTSLKAVAALLPFTFDGTAIAIEFHACVTVVLPANATRVGLAIVQPEPVDTGLFATAWPVLAGQLGATISYAVSWVETGTFEPGAPYVLQVNVDTATDPTLLSDVSFSATLWSG